MLEGLYKNPAVHRVGFVDETERKVDDITSLYGMVMVTYPVQALDQVRDRVMQEWKAGAGQWSKPEEYWHTTDIMWSRNHQQRDMARNERWVQEMAKVMSKTLLEHRVGSAPTGVVAVTVNVPTGDDLAKRQARDECLQQLTVSALKNRDTGPNLLVMDATYTSRRDVQVVAGTRRQVQNRAAERGEDTPTILTKHVHMGAEPVMWVADMVAWSLQRELTATSPHLRGPFVQHLRQHVSAAFVVDLPSGVSKPVPGLTALAEHSPQTAAAQVRAEAIVNRFERDYAAGRLKPQPGREEMRNDQAYHRSVQGGSARGGGYGR